MSTEKRAGSKEAAKEAALAAAKEHAAASAELYAQIDTENAADFVNSAAETALVKLQKKPDYESLADLFNALRQGHLVVDVTGTTTKKKGTRARTIRATNGKMVLPIFTSMAQLRKTVAGKTAPQGAIMVASEALQLIKTGPIVAIEINPGGAKQVLLRKYVELIISDKEITAQALENFGK